MTVTSQFADMTSPSIFLCFVSLLKFSYWSKFHVNIIAGSGVMTIFFYKGLSRNPEIGNTPIRVLSNIWRLGLVRNTKFDTNVSNQMLLNAAKCQGYSFYRFWVIKGKPTGDVILHIYLYATAEMKKWTMEVSINRKSSSLMLWEKLSGVFRTLPNIYDKAVLQILFTAKSCSKILRVYFRIKLLF